MNIQTNLPVIVLVTVNDHETEAVLDAFLGHAETPAPVVKGGLTYFDLGAHGGNHVIHTLCEMGAGGVGAAQQRTRDAIEHWQPRAIIAVGIGFGLDECKQAIGDVMVATQIQDYELARKNQDGTLTPRGDKAGSADSLRNRLRQVNTVEKRQGNGWPKVRFGLVLSGQKLVDNLDYRDSLKGLFSEAIGGEMEGGGVYSSASAARVDWILIKAICDWGFDKNHANKNAWQMLAARNAARVLKAALDLGALYTHAPEHPLEEPQLENTEKGVNNNAVIQVLQSRNEIYCAAISLIAAAKSEIRATSFGESKWNGKDEYIQAIIDRATKAKSETTHFKYHVIFGCIDNFSSEMNERILRRFLLFEKANVSDFILVKKIASNWKVDFLIIDNKYLIIAFPEDNENLQIGFNIESDPDTIFQMIHWYDKQLWNNKDAKNVEFTELRNNELGLDSNSGE